MPQSDLTIVCTAPPPDALREAFAAYDLRVHTSRETYLAALVRWHAALILVDGGRDDWREWVTASKSNPATRRIAVLVYSETPDAMNEAARLAGAERVLTVAHLAANAESLLHEYGRFVPPEVVAQMNAECGDDLPELAQQGVAQFNAGEYYAQHDLFEALWVQTETPVRDLYRAILQVGVAYYQIQRGNGRGAKKMLLRSQQWLAILPDACQGVDVGSLKADAARVYDALAALPDDDISGFDLSLLRPVLMIDGD